MNETTQFPFGQVQVPDAQRAEFMRKSAGPVLLYYWRMVLRWKWIIAGILVLSILLGIVVTLAATPMYTATTRIEISRDQKNVTNVQGVEPAYSGRDLEFYQTQYSLLKARSLAERVSRRLHLGSDAAFLAANHISFEKGGFVAQQRRMVSAQERAERDHRVAGMLLSGIQIGPVRGSSLVDVSYASPSAEISARIANAWVDEFIAQTIERRFASTADARSFLEGRLNEMRTRLEASERALTDYAVTNNIVRLSTRENAEGRTQVDRTLAGENLEALNAALSNATADRVAAESSAQAATHGSSSAALTNTAIAQMRQKRADLSADLARNLVQFDEGYPANRAIREQIAALDRSIAAEEGRVRSSFDLAYRQALARENELSGRVAALREKLGAEQRATIQYNILQREADSNRQLYEGLLQRYKEIGVAGVDANNISVVDIARVPNGPSSPNLFLNVLLALLLGVALAAVAAQVLDHIDEGLRDTSQVTEQLDLPLIGSVPYTNETEIQDALADPKSSISEALLTAQSNLSFTTEHGVPRSFVVTSTRASEGKSSTAVGIAMALTKVGKSVLLIDADMRRPSQHLRANVENRGGFSNVLAGDDDWARFVVDTPLGVRLLPSGPLPPSAAELLSTERLTRVINMMLEHVDIVIVDAPPMLGLADAPLIGRAVAGVLYVVEAEGAPLRSIRGAVDRLRVSHAHILGVIVTKLKRRVGSYGYGYGYGYDYDYGSSQNGKKRIGAGA